MSRQNREFRSASEASPRKLILTNFQAPGDAVMLTAAVRDLHRCHSGKFFTDVRTSYPQLWLNNPYLTPMQESDPEVAVIPCHYPLIESSNQIPRHFVEGFSDHLNRLLGLTINATEFKGDIHLSPEERTLPSPIATLLGSVCPHWLIVAGGKEDLTIKWWHHERFQAVVDAFRERVIFVQVGKECDHHPRLDGVVDMRGKTDLRELIRLVYHCDGVLSPVTLAMHLSAAVEVRGGIKKSRPCVVVAGGREPPQWESYPSHQFIHTIGALDCCQTGGCWKSRVEPLGDGSRLDRDRHLCVDVRAGIPHCMDMIDAEEVVQRIERYFRGGRCRYVTPNEWNAAVPHFSA